MFCGNCGENSSDNAELSGLCNNEDMEEDIYNPEEQEHSRILKIVLTGVECIVVLLLLVWNVSAMVGCVTGDPEDPIEYIIKGMTSGNVKTFAKALPKPIQEIMKEDKLAKKQIESDIDSVSRRMENEYGENIKISYRVLDKRKVKKEKLEDIESNIKEIIEDMGEEEPEELEVEAAYEYLAELKIKGEETAYEEIVIFTVYKVDGKWCTLDNITL